MLDGKNFLIQKKLQIENSCKIRQKEIRFFLPDFINYKQDLHRKDEDNATVSVTTSDGQAYVYQSVNGSDSIFSGKEYALRYFKKEIDMKIGETIHIVFECDACGNKQEIEIDSAFAGVIQCECPEKMDENGNAREYIAFEINYYTEEELFYKRKYEQTVFGDFDNK